MRNLLLMILLLAAPAFAQEQPVFLDSIHHSYGDGRFSFVDRDGKTCNFTARVEVQSPLMWQQLPYERAFSYTLRDLTPVSPADAQCNPIRRLNYDFVAICRAWSATDGSISADIQNVGTIQVLPRSSEVRAFWTANALNGTNWGMSVTRIWYRLSLLSDGGLQVLAYVPKGWDVTPKLQ